jgi:acyl-lipid omega-6 desaturase (Delta-12 desaturase)
MSLRKNESHSERKTWRRIVDEYQNPDMLRSLWQLISTLILYALFWILMAWSLGKSYWLTLLLALPAGGMVVRLFIIFHDCGHGSYFKSAKANHWVGSIVGVLVFTPYFYWRQSHAVHHATSGNLDKRGVGDVWTMTVDEFLAASPWKRFIYRTYRQPIFMLGVGPLIMFLFTHRLPTRSFRKREQASIHWTNLGILIFMSLVSWLLGFKNFWLIQIPVIWVAATAGVWLFYVQHQFEGVYWERAQNWDFVKAGLEGSSFYRLPKVLQWFSGNIGFHHIHHLSPKIPNYLLEKCHLENNIFQIQPLTLISSLKSLTFRLWDEKKSQLVNFRHLKIYRHQSPRSSS